MRPSENYQNNSWVKLEVEDTGIGLSEEEKATLFQRFRKGKHKQSGSGLGLRLVHRIVEVHQGTLTLPALKMRGFHDYFYKGYFSTRKRYFI